MPRFIELFANIYDEVVQETFGIEQNKGPFLIQTHIHTLVWLSEDTTSFGNYWKGEKKTPYIFYYMPSLTQQFLCFVVCCVVSPLYL